MPDKAKNDIPTPAPEQVADSRLTQNFELVMDAIREGRMACIIGVAITREGNMIDMFGTADDQLFESAAIVQNMNLLDNMRALQQRRIARQQAARQQAAMDATAKLQENAPVNDDLGRLKKRRAARKKQADKPSPAQH